MRTQIRENIKSKERPVIDFKNFQMGIKIGDQFFRKPQDQIKGEKEQVEECLQAIKQEQDKFKNKESLKPPMIQRFNVS